MKPSSLLRSFSSKLSARLAGSSAVAPWPPVRTAFDRWLTSELDDLWLDSHNRGRCTSAAWLSKVLELAVAAQKKTAEFAGASELNLTADDRKAVDDYLDDVIELLDACNGVRERMESIKTYVDAISIALHQLGGGEHEPSVAALRSARAALGSCEAMEKRCADLEKCGSTLRKLGEKLAASCSPPPPPPPPCNETSAAAFELREAISGSRAVALLAVAMLGTALSFKSRRTLPPAAAVHSTSKIGSWGASLHELQKEVKEEFEKRRRDGLVVLDELHATAAAARSLRATIGRKDRTQSELKIAMDVAKRRCRESEEKVKPLKEKIDELYRVLIGVRVSLLGTVTKPQLHWRP